MVKRLIYLTFLLCVRLMLMAQDISPMATAFLPLDGDSICYEFVEAKNPQESFSGKCTVWDFSSSKYLGQEKKMQYVKIDSVYTRMIGQSTLLDFIESRDTLFLSKLETPLVKIVFGKGLAYAKAPWLVGDSMVCHFFGKGEYCSQNIIEVSGSCSIRDMSQGNLILPSNTNMENVLMLKKEIEAVVCISKDSLSLTPERSLTFRATISEWYDAHYRYPIFKTLKANLYNNEQSFLSRNEALVLNSEKLDELSDFMYAHKDSLEQEKPANATGFTYHFAMNGNTGVVTYTIPSESHIKFIVSSLSGIVYQSHTKHLPAGENYQQHFNLSGMPKGDYVLYMRVDNELFSEKIHLK